MIDPLSATIDALTHHDLARLPIVFASGLITSVGPCMAPRYIALAAALDGSSRRWRIIGAFVAGLFVAYATLAFGVGVLAAVSRQTQLVELMLCVALIVAGIRTIVRTPGACAGHSSTHTMRRSSGVFSVGATSALVVSPCCTPVIAAITGMTAFDRAPWTATLFLATFALGHTMPLVFAGVLDGAVMSRVRRATGGAALAVISGTLMIALGAYYGILI